MVMKVVKYGVLSAVGLAVGGGAIFGTELGSYLASSRRAVRAAVKENVPIEFELRRARDLIDDLGPEIHASVRKVACQEVEIAALRRESDAARANLVAERAQVQGLRDALGTDGASFVFAGIRYTRGQVKDDLGRRFELLKEAEAVQAGKERLLQSRERSLASAAQALERTRSQRALLEGQIAALESQHQLLQAASAGTGQVLDQGKLAQAEQLMGRIKKDLDVTEQVLAHEARFAEPIAVDTVSEPDLLTRVDGLLAAKSTGATAAVTTPPVATAAKAVTGEANYFPGRWPDQSRDRQGAMEGRTAGTRESTRPTPSLPDGRGSDQGPQSRMRPHCLTGGGRGRSRATPGRREVYSRRPADRGVRGVRPDRERRAC